MQSSRGCVGLVLGDATSSVAALSLCGCDLQLASVCHFTASRALRSTVSRIKGVIGANYANLSELQLCHGLGHRAISSEVKSRKDIQGEGST